MYRPAFHTGDTIRHADDHAWLHHPHPAKHLVKEIAQHRLSDFVVSNHAVAQGTQHFDVLRCPTPHITCFLPDSHHQRRLLINSQGHQRRLLQHDAFVFIDQNIGCPEVNAQFLGKQCHFDLQRSRYAARLQGIPPAGESTALGRALPAAGSQQPSPLSHRNSKRRIHTLPTHTRNRSVKKLTFKYICRTLSQILRHSSRQDRNLPSKTPGEWAPGVTFHFIWSCHRTVADSGYSPPFSVRRRTVPARDCVLRRTRTASSARRSSWLMIATSSAGGPFSIIS